MSDPSQRDGPGISIRVLGSVEVGRDDGVVDLGPAKCQLLLAALALSAGSPVAQSKLIDLLWGDEPPRTATKTLQTYVTQLRKALGRALISRVGAAYQLDVDPGTVDAIRFERAFDQRHYEAALSEWSGRPLANIDSGGLSPVVAGLEERWLMATEAELTARVDEDPQESVGRLTELTADHPYREGLWVLLMTALYRCGRQSDALAAYATARRQLAEELGIEPSTALQELEGRILRQDRSLDEAGAARTTVDTAPMSPPADPAHETGISPSSVVAAESGIEAERRFPAGLDYSYATPLAGRARDIGGLEEIWERVLRDRRPGLVLLSGEPGVGKTRLAGDWCRQVYDRDEVTVVIGRCPEQTVAPFQAVTSALEAYARMRGDTELRTELGPGAQNLVPLMPQLTDRFDDLGSDRSVKTAEARLLTFQAAARFLERAATSPLVIVLDDVHWADDSTMALLTYLVRSIESGRLLIIGTYRDVETRAREEVGRALVDLRRDQSVIPFALEGLDADGVIELSESLLGQQLSEQQRRLASQIGADAGGNPLFLQEMIRHLIDSGALVRGDGHWQAVEPMAIDLDIPDSIRSVVRQRLRTLSEPCRELLRLMSVMPTGADIEVLIAVSADGEEATLDLLDEALDAALVVEDPSQPATYEFGHALIRQTLYDEISTPRRVRLHRRIAETIHQQYAANLRPHYADLAYHHFEGTGGGDPTAAIAFARLAADDALARMAFEEAVLHLERAREVLDGAASTEVEHAVLIDLGRAHAASGRQQTTIQTFDIAQRVADGHSTLVATTATSFARSYALRPGTDPLLLEAIKRHLVAASQVDDVPPVAADAIAGELLLLDQTLPVPHERFLGSEDPVTLRRLLGRTGTLPTEASEALLAHSLSLAERLADKPLLGECLGARAIFSTLRWDADRAHDDFARLRTLRDQPALHNVIRRSYYYEAAVAVCRSDWTTVDALLAESREIALPDDQAYAEFTDQMFPAIRSYDRSLDPPPGINRKLMSRLASTFFGRMIAFAACLRGDAPLNVDDLDLCLSLPELPAPVLTMAAEVIWERRDRDRAARMIPKLEVVADLWPTANLWPHSSTSRFLGLMHELLDEPDVALPLYQAANRRHREVGLIREEAYTAVDEARAHLHLSQTDAARAVIEDGLRRSKTANVVRAEHALRELAAQATPN